MKEGIAETANKYKREAVGRHCGKYFGKSWPAKVETLIDDDLKKLPSSTVAACISPLCSSHQE